MPPDSDQILAVGQEQTRFPCGERAVLHECIIQIENLLIRQMLTVTQLHIADGQLHRAAASKFVDLQMKGGIHGVALKAHHQHLCGITAQLFIARNLSLDSERRHQHGGE